MSVIERMQEPTPKFFKVLRAGGVMTAVSQAAVEKHEE
jgi:hypothetical protein